MFDKNFFKFFFGFLVIIGAALLVVAASSTYQGSGANIGDLIANFFR